MDEPLYYGHLFAGQGTTRGCQASILQVAGDVARAVRQVRSVFPDARIGDVEPLAGLAGESGPGAVGEWLGAFEAVTGERLAFLRLDVDWRAPWPTDLGAIASVLKAKGVPLQVIFSGNDHDRSEVAWIASANDHVQAYDAANLPPPDAAVLQTWVPSPSRVLPETDETRLTGFARWHLRRHGTP